jgi:hypothetical protein
MLVYDYFMYEYHFKHAKTLSIGLYRGAQAAARGAVPCASQIHGRGAEADARGAARCASYGLHRGAQAGAYTRRTLSR